MTNFRSDLGYLDTLFSLTLGSILRRLPLLPNGMVGIEAHLGALNLVTPELKRPSTANVHS